MDSIYLAIISAVLGSVATKLVSKDNYLLLIKILKATFSVTQFDAVPLRGYNSFFVGNNPQWINIVLQVRKNVFGNNALTSDESYRKLTALNKFAYKLVFSGNFCAGYWSIIPINEKTYNSFIENKMTHSEVLSESLLWENVDKDIIYLYIVGIVGNANLKMEVSQIKSSLLIYDMFSFGETLFNSTIKKNIGGICGYPSRNAGLNLFNETLGFVWNGNCIDGKKNQRIYICEGANISLLQHNLEHELNSKTGIRFLPKWIDRENFLNVLAKTN